MQTDPSSFAAPGAPGTESFWSRSAKDGVGTAYHTGCRVWFTLAHGIVTEVYCPTVDTPNTRDLEFLVTDGETFCHEEKRDLLHAIEVPEAGALLYRLTNREPNGRYRLVKEVLADPHSSVLLVHTRLEIADHSLRGKLRLFALLAPHLGGYGAENRADWLDRGERTLLHAEREDFHLMFGCDRGFSRRSVGYAGVSDGWQDLHKGNFQMDWQYRQAGPGSVALTGEIPLTEAENGGGVVECVLGLAFGDSAVSAAAKLMQSMATPFQKHREVYVAQWQRTALDPREEQTFAANTGRPGGHLSPEPPRPPGARGQELPGRVDRLPFYPLGRVQDRQGRRRLSSGVDARPRAKRQRPAGHGRNLDPAAGAALADVHPE